MTCTKAFAKILKTRPRMLEHEGVWEKSMREIVACTVLHEQLHQADMEKAIMSVTERNVLNSLNLPNKFESNCLPTMEVMTHCLAKHKGGDSDGTNSIKHKKAYNLRTLGNGCIAIDPSAGISYTNTMSTMCAYRDTTTKLLACSNLGNISANAMEDLPIGLLCERILADCDYKHLFIKGYLYLMDMLVNATNGTINVGLAEVDKNIYLDKGADTLFDASRIHRVVVSMNQLGPSLCGLLTLLGEEYPSMTFGEENIYSQVSMVRDNVAILTKKELTAREAADIAEYVPESPMQFYSDLVKLAQNLDALDDLKAVFQMMRGKVPFLHHLSETTGDDGTNVFSFQIQKSIGYKHMLSVRRVPKVDFLSESNYFATSKSLVCDLLMGECLKLGIVHALEDIAAFGKVGCDIPGHENEDLVLKSKLKEHWFNSDTKKKNQLYNELNMIVPSTISTNYQGSMYFTMIAMIPLVRERSLMTIMAPLDFCIHNSVFKNTCWAKLRGFDASKRFETFVSKGDSIIQKLEHQAFLWSIGATNMGPRIGINAVGVTNVRPLGAEERELAALARGMYETTCIEIGSREELAGRSDIEEHSLSGWYSQTFEGDIGGVTFVENVAKEHVKVVKDIKSKTLRTTLTKLGEAGKEKEVIKKIDVTAEEKVTELYGLRGKSQGPSKSDYILLKDKSILGRLHSDSILYDSAGFDIEPIKPGDRYRVQNVSGQGALCGARAVALDLLAHGYVTKDVTDEVADRLAESTGHKNWFAIDELATIVNEAGFGFSAYEAGSGRVHNYGITDAIHTVRLLHQGNHFQTLVRSDSGDLSIPNNVEEIGFNKMPPSMSYALLIGNGVAISEMRRDWSTRYGMTLTDRQWDAIVEDIRMTGKHQVDVDKMRYTG